ncbi:MAG: hypothetical protein CR986_06110 [Ignavibacteriae bacterium]|nr:MAG: hypothetical protein CR986_06110 [Ignavibacteriota bacterium]
MKNNKIIKSLIFSFIIIVFSFGCADDTTPTIYRDIPNGKAPVITAVEPADTCLAGVSRVTITGENFSSDISKLVVFFNSEKAKIFEASETRIVVQAPYVLGDSIAIKIGVQGSLLYNEPYYIEGKPPVVSVINFLEIEEPYGIALDNKNTLFFNMVLNSVSNGLKKFTAAEGVIDFSPKGGESNYLELRYFDNALYGTRIQKVRAIFKSVENTSPKALPVSNKKMKFTTLDFDKDKNIWAGGEGGEIYSFSQDFNTKVAFSFDGKIQSMRYFDKYLYFVGQKDSLYKIWRTEIFSADSIGPIKEYYNLTENLGDYTATSITFSKDGKLFIGTSAEGYDPNALVYLDENKNIVQWYPGLISGPVLNLTWDNTVNLYYVRQKVEDKSQSQLIMRINTGLEGAPQFGKD